MSKTTYRDYNRFTSSATGMNQLLDDNIVDIDNDIHTLSGTITTNSDHGNLTGKGDDDHTQYSMFDGTRTFLSGVTGWIDDGTNFRMTVTSGIVTNITATVSGGYQLT